METEITKENFGDLSEMSILMDRDGQTWVVSELVFDEQGNQIGVYLVRLLEKTDPLEGSVRIA